MDTIVTKVTIVTSYIYNLQLEPKKSSNSRLLYIGHDKVFLVWYFKVIQIRKAFLRLKVSH